ncbi:MAG: winged helix-turn-helix transcriptional regulator [Paludibacteraceae bacterium]|nr:winged helix-turn-helix transcriptional regulator [Paludibacteraceae bacterium]
MKTNPYITRDELSKVLGIYPSAIQKHIDKLKEVRIRRIGGDFGGHWEIIS